jgi:hypothetical protein
MLGFTALYGVLAVIGAGLFVRTVREGPDPAAEPAVPGDPSTEPPSDLAIAY